jgi:hypothetical protein
VVGLLFWVWTLEKSVKTMAAPFLAFEPSQHQIIDLSPFESNNYFFFTPQSQKFEAEIESHLRARGSPSVRFIACQHRNRL